MKFLKIVCYTLFSIILSYYVSILAHEYSHATMAWLYGYKTSPFDISYGSWYLIPVSENVDYGSIYASGHGMQEAFIGISGLSANVILFFISLFILSRKFIQARPLLLSLFFWLASLNLMEMFSYLNRTFVMGDLGEFVQGLNISPLWVFFPLLILVGWGIYWFYKYELNRLFIFFPIKKPVARRIILWLTFWPLPLTVIYWKPPVNFDWQGLSNVTNFFSIFAVLCILIICDPGTRR